MVKENLKEVEEKIRQACLRSGRDPKEVTLIAVSKTKPVSMIEEAYAQGIRNFGENKPQELKEKDMILPDDIYWHMIGHLQRNKIKYVLERAKLIHSVDSVRLAEAIEEEAAKRRADSTDSFWRSILQGRKANSDFCRKKFSEPLEVIPKLPHLRVEGLMTIAPFVENAEENRIHFKNLRKLSVDIEQKNIDNVNMCNLSMGMTGDYEIAIEEGATMVRVGTGIFGERSYIK